MLPGIFTRMGDACELSHLDNGGMLSLQRSRLWIFPRLERPEGVEESISARSFFVSLCLDAQ